MRIPKSEAEGYIKDYLSIKENIQANEQSLSALSQDARNYVLSPMRSFIFTKDRIDDIFSQGGNALRIYYATHPQGDPTIVVVPCHVSEEETEVQNYLGEQKNLAQQTPKPRQTLMKGNCNSFDLEDDPLNQ